MTICIAAKSLKDNCIVAISDRMLSYQDSVPATEGAADKILLVSADWRAMIAGDVRYARPIINRVQAKLPKAIAEISFGEIKRAFRDAYQAELQQNVTDRFLGRYAMTLEMFRKEGFQCFGASEFAKLNDAIKSFSLGIQFIVFGTSQGFNHIVVVDDPGEIRECEEEGFAIIGSGELMALGVLAARSIKQSSIEELIYRLCDAKFTSETAHGVGRDTTVVYLSTNGIAGFVDPVCVENLRIEWEQKRKTGISPEMQQIIKAALRA